MDAESDVLNIGMAGTEEMYCAVTEFGACARIEVTASHNSINYNGMKIVKSGSRLLDDVEDLQKIKMPVEFQAGHKLHLFVKNGMMRLMRAINI
jgi:phosphomannomutase